LIIDYGSGDPGYGDTLRAVRQHAHDDVLAAPGEADLSAHVDFSALAQGAQRGGAVSRGPIAQADFLRAIGIETRGRQLARNNPESAAAVAAAVDRLTGAEAMGKLFKILALAPPDAPVPPGFH
jgi:SAM-dependent MidA family methyltransferase